MKTAGARKLHPSTDSALDQPLLSVKDLKTVFHTGSGIVRAVDGVSFHVAPGKTLCVVGESGSGKSVTALSILRLTPGKIISGEVTFEGRDLIKASTAEMRRIRGSDIAMIFQDPMTSLNPLYTVGYQIGESYRIHQNLSSREATNRATEMLRQVGVASPHQRVHEYPHQMSGGMRQRVMIAMALACRPKLLIADEPTTALDVTIQAQILELMKELREQIGTSTMLITHDLGVVAEMADEVVVMYGGQVMEQAPVYEVFEQPAHPYTLGLLRSIPSLDEERETLEVIPGNVPNPKNFPSGCRFHPRCPFATEQCKTDIPALEEARPGHWVRCWHPQS